MMITPDDCEVTQTIVQNLAGFAKIDRFSLTKCQNMTEFALSSQAGFFEHFANRLQQLLEQKELGVLILALANALARKNLYLALQQPLQEKFSFWQQYLQNLSADDIQKIPADDLLVFRALLNMDLKELPIAAVRSTGRWRLQFHPLRSLRPARNSGKAIDSLFQPFDPLAFHFNKPFLRKEILWQGEIAARPVRLLYNKFPFADYHGILVINAEACHPQYLQQQDCNSMQAIYQQLSPSLEMGMAYNSLGAMASVNHQHWQSFVSDSPYPIELDCWQHNGGGKPYPLRVKKYDSLPDAWPEIDRLQRGIQAFHIFMNNGCCWLIRRKRQGNYQTSAWNNGFAWSEAAGIFLAGTEADFRSVSALQIEQEFSRLATA